MKLLILHPFPLIRTTLSCPGEEVHTQEGDDSDSDKHKGNVTVLQETEEIILGKCQAYVNSLKRMIYPP